MPEQKSPCDTCYRRACKSPCQIWTEDFLKRWDRIYGYYMKYVKPYEEEEDGRL